MQNNTPVRIKTIAEFHRFKNLPKPEHPLISVVDYASLAQTSGSAVFDFYSIAVKKGVNGKMFYGQQQYDFDEGIMFFMAPNQVLRVEAEENIKQERSGWILLIHPDFLWNTPLAKTIRQYEYFDYSANEALFLSPKEETVINNIIQNIQHEYHSSIDKFSQNIIIAQLEVLLNYAERFYQRQFITRKITNHKILERLEDTLNKYFDSDDLLQKGLPTVQYVADELHVRPII